MTCGVGFGLGAPVEKPGVLVFECQVLGEGLGPTQRGRGVRRGLRKSPEASEVRCRGNGVIYGSWMLVSGMSRSKCQGQPRWQWRWEARVPNSHLSASQEPPCSASPSLKP